MTYSGGRHLQRLAAWLLISQQLLVGTGVGLSASVAPGTTKERYPCENCACGCRSAEQCWTRCCCFTNEQKLRWAEQAGVAAPAFVVAAAKQETAAARKPKCSHCVGRAGPAVETPRGAAGVSSDSQRPRGKTRPPRGVFCLDVLRCRGLTQHWQATGAGWPGDPPVELRIVPPLLGGVEPQPLLKVFFAPPAPPTPPPNTI